MKLGLVTYLLSLFVSAPLSVERVEVSGNRAVSTKLILKELDLERGDALEDAEIEDRVNRVLRTYRDRGYWRARIDLERSGQENGVVLRLVVDEGQPTVVVDIVVEGNSVFADEEILADFDTKVGTFFRESSFRGDVYALLNKYGNKGYPFCKVSPQSFSLDSSGIRFSLAVKEGPLVVIEKLEVTGNQITKPYVILREMEMREGEVYHQDRIDRGVRRVGRLPFLAHEPLVELKPADGPGRLAMVVEVVEGMPNRATGALGYLPRAEGGGEITGAFDLTLGNLFGTGRRVEANWRRLSSLSSYVRLEYLEPWVFSRRANISLGFSHRLQDTSYTETELKLSLDTPISEDISFIGSAGWERVVPGALDIARSTKYKAALGAALDKRDNPRNPRAGVLYRISTEYGYKRNFSTQLVPDPVSRARVVKGIFSLQNFLSTFSSQVLCFSLNGGEVRSTEGDVPANELLKLGGARTLRGYYEDEFSGERVGWGNLEYRFLIGRDSRLGPFLDGGYIQPRKGEDKVLVKFGYGLGLRVGTSWGVFFLDYGLGERDSPLNGKVHFGVETQF